MALFFAFLFSFSITVFAGLDQIKVEKLNMNYTDPKGIGDVEKLTLNFSLVENARSPVEIEKVEESYVLRTPMLDLNWNNPGKFLLFLQSVVIQNFSGNLGSQDHAITADALVLKPEGDGDYKLQKIVGECHGTSKAKELGVRLMDDCREKMKLEMSRLDVPMNVKFIEALEALPKSFNLDNESVRDFYLTSCKGDFFMYFLARYVVTAGLRTWGHLSYENDHKTVVIKIHQIKFGYIPVTGAVLRTLKAQIKNPRIKVEPPFIRIQLEE